MNSQVWSISSSLFRVYYLFMDVLDILRWLSVICDLGQGLGAKITIYLASIIGAITATGSVTAFAKLQVKAFKPASSESEPCMHRDIT